MENHYKHVKGTDRYDYKVICSTFQSWCNERTSAAINKPTINFSKPSNVYLISAKKHVYQEVYSF